MKSVLLQVIMVSVALFAGCGGGGGGGGSAPTRAIVKLSSQGTLAPGQAVSGFGVTIELPAGATVQTTAGGSVDATVVTPSGLLATAYIMGPMSFTPAAGAVKARLSFTIASTAAGGVGKGEYATVEFLLNGISPTASDFTVLTFTPVDLLYANISTLTAAIAMTLQ